MQLDPPDTSGTIWKTVKNFVKIGFGFAGLARNGVALYDIFSHIGAFNTLPFLSPVLWLDMALVYDIARLHEKTQPLAYLAVAAGVGMLFVCFWLVIGYSFLGYGTRQYQALNIPPYCQDLGVSWETDPRRRNFVRMQAVLFLSAAIGMVVAAISYNWLKKMKESHDVQTMGQAGLRRTWEDDSPPSAIINAMKSFGEWKTRVSQRWKKRFGLQPRSQDPAPESRRIPLLPKMFGFKGAGVTIPKFEFNVSEHLTAIVMLFVIVPFLVGVFLGAALNWNSYLILGQKGCYASYVSGRWGYVDLQLINFRIKLATWLGLNT